MAGELPVDNTQVFGRRGCQLGFDHFLDFFRLLTRQSKNSRPAIGSRGDYYEEGTWVLLRLRAVPHISKLLVPLVYERHPAIN
jgi:hypothetical protein